MVAEQRVAFTICDDLDRACSEVMGTEAQSMIELRLMTKAATERHDVEWGHRCR